MRNNYLDEEDELDDDLMEYLSSFLTSSDANGTAACNQEDNQYTQLTLADVFPCF